MMNERENKVDLLEEIDNKFKPAAFRMYVYEGAELQEIFETPKLKTLFRIVYGRYALGIRGLDYSKKSIIRDLALMGMSTIKYGVTTVYIESYTRFEKRYPNLSHLRHNLMPLATKYCKLIVEELFALISDPLPPDSWDDIMDEVLGQFDITDFADQIARGEFQAIGYKVYEGFDLEALIDECETLREDTDRWSELIDESEPFAIVVED